MKFPGRWAVIPALLPLFLALGQARAQGAVTVTGYVSAAGAPVEGANISMPQLGLGASTDREGRYSFIVPAARVQGQTVVLMAKHRRYPPQSAYVALVGGSLVHDFELTLATSGRPDEPTVVPAATLLPAPATEADLGRRDVLSNGITIDGRSLSEVVGATSIAAALSGRVAGLSVTTATAQGGSTRLALRGPKSVFGDDQPLLVLDGLPIDNSSFGTDVQQRGGGGFDYGTAQQDLNLADIASVTVLKGPAAAILYGSRASNGALVVTTKTGRDLNGFAVSASQQLTMESLLRLPSYQNHYGQGLGGAFEFVNGLGAGTNDTVKQSWGPALDDQPRAQFSLTEAKRAEVRLWQSHPDNVRKFFGTGRTLSTEVAAQASTDRAGARLSFSNQDVGGILPNSYFVRQTAALNLTGSPSQRLRFAGTAQYANNRGDNRAGTGYDVANPMVGFTQFGRQVDLAALEHRRIDAAGNQINWNYAGVDNPYFGAFENGNGERRQRVIGSGSAMFELTSWLTVTGRVGTDSYHDARDFHVASGWMGGFVDLGGRGDFTKGGFQNQDVYSQQTNWDLALRATKETTNNLALALTLGANRRNDDVTLETVGSDELITPGVYALDNSAKATMAARDDARARTNAMYASADIALRDVASLSIGARSERTSALPKGADSYVDPAVSASFSFTRAVPALRLGGLLSDGRLHAQWARASDASFAMLLPEAPIVPFGTIPRTDVPDALTISRTKPETTEGWDAGVTLESLGGRLATTVTLYAERRSNQMLNVVAPPSSGFSSALLNGGEIVNRGIEMAMRATVLHHRSLSWDVGVNYASNKNEVRALYPGLSSLPLGPPLWGLTVEARQGYPLGALVGSGFLRDAASQQLVLRNGLPLPDTVAGPRVLGSAVPRWTGGLTNQIRYRALELSALVDVHIGGKIFSATNMWGAYSGVLAETAFRPDTGLLIAGVDAASGKSNTTHVTTEEYYHSLLPIQERWVYDASYAKLREARLTFTFTAPFRGLTRGSTMRASLIGRNLFLWSKAPNIDPETTLGTSSFQGVELGQLPSVRSIGLQLSIAP